MPLLAGIILCGGILGPVLMLVGLGRLSGMAASLLLNLEGPFTILLALFVFGEHLGRSAALAAGLVLTGAMVLGIQAGEVRGDVLGVLSLAGACLAWAVDNNLTQRLSLKDPVVPRAGEGARSRYVYARSSRSSPASTSPPSRCWPRHSCWGARATG